VKQEWQQYIWSISERPFSACLKITLQSEIPVLIAAWGAGLLVRTSGVTTIAARRLVVELK
jgi:hypothetical protein